MLDVGSKAGHYTIIEKIGSGAMGEVFRARDERLRRDVALKVLPEKLLGTEDAVKRFNREASIVSALNHPNVVTIYEIGEYDGSQYIAMELVHGTNLRSYIPRRLEVDEFLKLAAQMARALIVTHAEGITHRDIKPDNIIVRKDGIVKVLDFGLAKLENKCGPLGDRAMTDSTLPGTVLGSPRYMSPEQARGESSGCPSDIFSLGIILYELSCGRHPFQSDFPMEVLRQIMSEDPPPPSRWRNDLPERLDALILWMLKKNPADRPVAAEVERELDDLSKTGGVAASGSLSPARAISAPAAPARTPEPLKLHPDDPSRRGNGRPGGKFAVTAALALLITAGGAFLFFAGKGESSSVNSVAIMPFINVNGDTNTQYLSDGLTESVIDSVSQLPNLKVLASSTVFRYKRLDLDPRQIGADLRVDAVMTGRVTHQGQAISTTAELVRVSDGSRIWGGEFNRRVSDLIALKQDMAGEIADRLNRKLGGKTVAARRSNPDNEAYRLYLLGRFYWHKRTEEAINTSVAYIEKAIALDRNFALAHSGLADALLIKATHADGLAAKALVDQAKAEADLALGIDDTLAEAHATLGMIAAQYYQWEISKKEFLRSIELNPNYATAHQWYAMMLLDTGILEESASENRIAQDLDPLSIVITLNMANLYSLKHDSDRALAEIAKARDIDPHFPLNAAFEGIVYMREHRYPEALAAVRKAVTDSNRNTFALGQLAWICGLSGLTNEVKTIALELEKQSPDGSGNSGAMTFVALGLSDRDRVFACLKKGFETHEFIPGILLLDPSFDSYRKDPRYAELLKSVGLKPEGISPK